ncbi:MAG: FmdB family zinc ribbon protein [Solirubrobacterales bacterium]
MPIYEYRCASGHAFEVFRAMADEPLTECVECGAAVERVFHPIAVHYKGSGFYTTDYAKKGAAATDGSDSSSKSDSDSSKSGGDSNTKSESSKKAETKTDSGKSSS